MKVSASAPGKLYIAGEYAVVEPGFPSILVAVNRLLTIHIEEAQQGWIHSNQDPSLYVSWRRTGNQHISCADNPYPLVTEAIRLTEAFLLEKEWISHCSVFQLEIQSELDDSVSGKKYGLGSSAAVTVATVEAILKLYQAPYDAFLLFKLSALAQLNTGANGSMGDIAAAAFGGWIAYHSFDRLSIRQLSDCMSLVDLVETDWQGLHIEVLPAPTPLELLVGWTQTPASTTNFVKEAQKESLLNQKTYQDFLSNSRSCVDDLITAFRQHHLDKITSGIKQYRALLRFFSREMGILIETDTLSTLCELAIQQGASAKSSGAGGGDCGICLVSDKNTARIIQEAWKKHSILPLDLHPYVIHR